MPRGDATIFYSTNKPAYAYIGGAKTEGGSSAPSAPGTSNPVTANIFGAKIVGGAGSLAGPIAASLLRNAGYLLVDDYGADPDGNDDSITAINNCITDARDVSKPIWFTEGATYLVSDTVRCFKWDKNTGSGFNPTLTPQCIGGGSGLTRPLIKLIDGAAKMQNANDARPVVVYRHFQFAGEGNEPTDVLDDQGVTPGSGFESLSANNFYGTWQNIDIDCGDNPGAFGMYFPSAQRCFCCDVTIDARRAAGGWWGTLGRNSNIMNVKIIGGVVQIQDSIGIQKDGNAGCMLAGVTLEPDNRTVSPILFDDLVPFVIVGFNFRSNGFNGDWFQINNFGSTANGQLAAIDGIVTGGGRVIENAAGKNVYARNIYVTGTTDLIQSGNQQPKTGAGTWSRIAEYSYTDQTAVNASSANYLQQNIIDGIKTSNPEVATTIETSVAAPTRDYVADHTIFINRIDSGNFEDVTNPIHAGGAQSGPSLFSGSAYSDSNNYDNTTPDAYPAFVSAIAAAKAAGHNRVLVPRGFFYMSQTLDLEPDTKLFGVSAQYSKIGVKGSWQPTSKVYVLRTANDQNGTCQVAEVAVSVRSVDPGLSGTPFTVAPLYDWFSWIHWRTGKYSSSTWRINGKEYNGNQAYATNPHEYHYFTGNGGGKHYSLTDQAGRGYSTELSIGLRVENTSQPLQIYGFNPEMGKAGQQGQTTTPYCSILSNASNIRIYGTKREGSGSTMLLNGVRNFAHFGDGRGDTGAGNEDGISSSHHIKGSSENYLFTNIVTDFKDETGGANDYFSYEDVTGQSAIGISYPNGVSIHKRGELDDDIMLLGDPTPPANSAPVAQNVTVSGTPVAGSVLTGSYTYFDADGDIEGGTAFRWLRNGIGISGATSQTYLLTANDSGSTIYFEVTPSAVTGEPTGVPTPSAGYSIGGLAQVITDIDFNFTSLRNVAPGNGVSALETDNWPITWAADGNQYTSFGDGFGFGNLPGQENTRASIGWTRISGGKGNYSAQDLYKSGKNAGGSNGKCQGMLAANGKLYTWWDAKDTNGPSGGSQADAYISSVLCKTENYLASGGWDDLLRWDNADWGGDPITNIPGWFGPTFLQFGQDYSGARDNYVYVYVMEHDNGDYECQTPGGVSLMRCLLTNLESGNKASWEYVVQFDGNQVPTWSNNIAARIPVFQDTQDGNHISSVSYNAPLGRYVMTTFHKTRATTLDGGQCTIGFYEAGEPWGPWNTILKQDVVQLGLADGNACIMWNFSNKWLSADGLDFVLVGTLLGQDEWGTIEGTFSVFEPPTPPPPVGFPDEHFTTVSVNPGPASLTLPSNSAMLVVGMSNTHHWTNTLMPLANPTSKTEIINGAQGSYAAQNWAFPQAQDDPWDTAAGFVTAAGYTANDVSVVFISAVDRLLGDTYEQYIARLETNLRQMVVLAEAKYPNAIIIMNGLHNEFWANSHPEPHAWASSSITSTIVGDTANVYWGPYIWNPEPNGRSGDGFNITEADHQPLGNVHLEEWGNVKVANAIMNWFDIDSIGQSIFK